MPFFRDENRINNDRKTKLRADEQMRSGKTAKETVLTVIQCKKTKQTQMCPYGCTMLIDIIANGRIIVDAV